jgi:hypothetical protein|tara:strand:- start:185 stop:424 length:240 start_codon:yes stop_codon:yes gene_type:complete
VKIGDLVMWVGTHQDHGCIGIVTSVVESEKLENYYTVVWRDAVVGSLILDSELQLIPSGCDGDDSSERLTVKGALNAKV